MKLKKTKITQRNEKTQTEQSNWRRTCPTLKQMVRWTATEMTASCCARRSRREDKKKKKMKEMQKKKKKKKKRRRSIAIRTSCRRRRKRRKRKRKRRKRRRQVFPKTSIIIRGKADEEREILTQ